MSDKNINPVTGRPKRPRRKKTYTFVPTTPNLMAEAIIDKVKEG